MDATQGDEWPIGQGRMDQTRDTGLPIAEKLADAEIAGFGAECTPEEADVLGAFEETGLSLHDITEDLQEPDHG